jgi:hypothetical protein
MISRAAAFWTGQPATGGESRAALHAELAASGEHVALYGSANLTDKERSTWNSTSRSATYLRFTAP